MDSPSPPRLSPRRRLGRWWRHRAHPVWASARPLVVVVAGVSALVLGTIGFLNYEGADYDFLDSLYRAIGLFGLGGAVEPPVPTSLQIARILAPVVTGYAAIRGLIAVSREQLELASIRLFARDHVVVAGLGEVGRRLARSFDDRGDRVVVIESDSTSPYAEGARERGMTVVAGNAADPELLRRTAADRARLLFLACGEDGINVDAASAARDLVAERRRGVLTAFAHLDDLELHGELNVEAVGTARDVPLRLEFFNVFATAARLAVERRPPFDPNAETPEEPHILVAGLESMGEQLVLHLARSWQAHGPPPGARLRITLTGPNARADLGALVARQPDLGRVCSLDARELDFDSGDFRRGGAMTGELGECDVTFAYVCLWSEAQALAVALALHDRPDTRDVPVMVAVSDAKQGVGTALSSDEGRMANIEPIGVFSEAASPALVRQGTTELLARAKHEEYRRSEEARGDPAEENPANVPWEDLAEPWKESNRRFADGIGRKLEDAGCRVGPAPLMTDGAAPFAFSEEEVEQMAVVEHDRWMNDLIRDGWRYHDGPKDRERKLHPMLVPWEELPEVERDKDRNPIRELPQMLARAGLRIYRL